MTASIADCIAARGIKHVLHFTTGSGLAGILASRGVLPRKRLPEDKYLEHVFKPNAEIRRDHAWLDYVNLSITSINKQFFGVSAGKWHTSKDTWWAILDFAPEILCHEGVVFATTNNMYSGVNRARGTVGLEALFVPRVHQYLTKYVVRGSGHTSTDPTCPQAEALYPGTLSTEYLREIVTQTGEADDAVAGQLHALRYEGVRHIVDPAAFEEV